MVRDQFDDAFERMREQSNRLAETQRTTDNFDEIVEQRVELDRLRDEVTSARKQIVCRFEPPAPDLVFAPRGHVTTKLGGKIWAAISVALLVVAAFVALLLARTLVGGYPVKVDNIVESVKLSDSDSGRTPQCIWTVEATVHNDTENQVQILAVLTVLNRKYAGASRGFFPTIPAGESAPLIANWNLGTSECPSVSDIARRNLILRLDNGVEVSHGF